MINLLKGVNAYWYYFCYATWCGNMQFLIEIDQWRSDKLPVRRKTLLLNKQKIVL